MLVEVNYRDKMHFQIPFHTLTRASCFNTTSCNTTYRPVCVSACIYMRKCVSICMSTSWGGVRKQSTSATKDQDFGSNTICGGVTQWADSRQWILVGRGLSYCGQTRTHIHTRAYTNPNTNTERLHQHREAQTDRWANSWLTVCYETLSLCQWNQNNILGVNAGLVTANRTPHGRDRCIWTVMDGGGKMFCC